MTIMVADSGYSPVVKLAKNAISGTRLPITGWTSEQLIAASADAAEAAAAPLPVDEEETSLVDDLDLSKRLVSNMGHDLCGCGDEQLPCDGEGGCSKT